MTRIFTKIWTRAVMTLLLMVLTATTAWADFDPLITGYTATTGTLGASSNEGYANLVDNDKTTKWCLSMGNQSSILIVFQTDKPIVPTGYVLTTGNDNATCTGRNPKNWVIKAKRSYWDAWTTIASVTDDQTMEDENNKDFEFALTNTEAYQYFLFEVTALRGSTVFQLSEFQFRGKEDNTYLFTSYTATDGTSGFSDNEGYAKLVDNDKTTKWCVDMSKNSSAFIEFQADRPIVPKGYVMTTGNDNAVNTHRNPKKWTIMAKKGDSWITIASVTNDQTLMDENRKDFEFTISNPENNAYKYFRFVVTATQGSAVFQLSEFQFRVKEDSDNKSGKCGESVTYDYDSDKHLLVISGNGDMTDYITENDVPWWKYEDDIYSVEVEEGVTSIGWNAFRGYENLKDVKFPNSLKTIGAYAFYDDPAIKEVAIPAGVTSIDERAFFGCSNLATIEGCAGVTYMGMNVFHNTKWYNNQEDGLVYLGSIAYKYKGEMPENTEIAIKDGTTVIAAECFDSYDCLTSVTIPNSVTSIGHHAFVYCKALTVFTIPASVTYIGVDAFRDCSGITDVYCYADPNELTWNGGRLSAFIPSYRETVCHVYDAAPFQAKWNTGNMYKDVNVTFVGDLKEIETAIENVITAPDTDGAWYTLTGVKLEGEPTEKGIYINNGKQVYVK